MSKAKPLLIGMAGAALAMQAGCAPGSHSVMAGPAPVEASALRPSVPRESDVITREEIRAVEAGSSALDAVRRLRPEYLQHQGTTFPDDPYGGFAAVYLDGVRLGELRTLQTIPILSIVEIRFVRASAAAEWLGRNSPRGGVIAVSTAR